MENRHVKFGYEEALFAKKEILYAEIDILEAIKRLRNYRLLRKKDFMLKNSLKTSLKSTEMKIKLLQSTFPQEERPKTPRIRVKKIEKGYNKHIQNQLATRRPCRLYLYGGYVMAHILWYRKKPLLWHKIPRVTKRLYAKIPGNFRTQK